MAPFREYLEDGYRIKLDLTPQVLGVDFPVTPQWPAEFMPLLPPRGGMVSAATMALKAAQFSGALREGPVQNPLLKIGTGAAHVGIADVVDRLRAHSAPSPTSTSDWREYEAWALEPVIVPERMPEAKRLSLDRRYREHLLDVFARSTVHSMGNDVEPTPILRTMAARPTAARKTICVRPNLSAEPHPSFYLRSARSFQTLRQALAAAPAHADRKVTEALTDLESLFYGAHVSVARELGLEPAAGDDLGSGQGPDADAAHFKEWARRLTDDPNLAGDARVMIPVSQDGRQRRWTVWVMLGWGSRAIDISFDVPPRLIGLDAEAAADTSPDVAFVRNHEELVFPVSAEVQVGTILSRDDFRRHCDKYGSPQAILANLR